MDRIEKALLGEGLASCDNCGHVAPMEEFYPIVFGERGERMDLCEDCVVEGFKSLSKRPLRQEMEVR
jgi:hypothetical protein